MSNVLLISHVVLWIVVLVQTAVLIELLRQIGMLRARVGWEPGALLDPERALPRGSRVPPFSATDLRTGEVVTEAILAGKPTLIVFLSPNCSPCRSLASGMTSFARDIRGRAQVIGICVGPRGLCSDFAHEFRLAIPMLLDESQEVSKMFRASSTPNALFVDADGLVRLQGIPNEVSHLDALLEEEGTPIGNRKWLEEPVGEQPRSPTAP